MDNFESNSWQTRWSGLADRLEVALEKPFRRALLCAASVGLVLIYAYFATRFAQPSLWTASRSIVIETDATYRPQFLQVDTVNRSIVRLHQISSILQLKPTPVAVRPDQKDFEIHILRLWLDEIRGFGSEGMYDVVAEALVRAIFATVGPSHAQSLRNRQISDETSANWFSHLRSFRETCKSDDLLKAHPQWRGLCSTVSSQADADFDRPNPMSLSTWLSQQIVKEAEELSPAGRIAYLRGLVHRLAKPELARFERLSTWPTKAADFGPTLKELVSILAPAQARRIDFSPRIIWIRVSLDEPDFHAAVDSNLVVLVSCDTPTLKRVMSIDVARRAKEVLWAKVCDAKVALTQARSVFEFAEKNPTAAFIQIGPHEIEVALRRGWLKESTTVLEMLSLSSGGRGGNASAPDSNLLRSQQTNWDAAIRTYRFRSPVEVVKMVRVDAAMERRFRDF